MTTLSILILSITIGMIVGSVVTIYSVLVMASESESDMAIAGGATSAFELTITEDGQRIVRDGRTVAASLCEPKETALGVLIAQRRVFVQAAHGNAIVDAWIEATGGTEWHSAMGWGARR